MHTFRAQPQDWKRPIAHAFPRAILFQPTLHPDQAIFTPTNLPLTPIPGQTTALADPPTPLSSSWTHHIFSKIC